MLVLPAVAVIVSVQVPAGVTGGDLRFLLLLLKRGFQLMRAPTIVGDEEITQ